MSQSTVFQSCQYGAQSTIFQSCRGGATASRVLTSILRSKCVLLKETKWCHTALRMVIEPRPSLFGVRCSSTCRRTPLPGISSNMARFSGLLKNTTRDVGIRKTCPCNVYPLEPHFYIAKLGYAGVYLFFLLLLKT